MEIALLGYGAVAAIGAGLQELAYWYELRARLEKTTYRCLLSSRAYWITTCLMVLGSGLGTVVWFYPDAPGLRAYLVTGAAFPMLLKKAVSTATAQKPTVLGATTSLRSAYFFGRN